MFSYLHGKLTEKNLISITIDCAGVGYDLAISLTTYEKLPQLNETVKLFVHFYMNDEGIRLFGFHTPQEREMFRLLISVSRIGPKLAIAVLSGITTDNLVSAIKTGNDHIIATIPGLGKKTAQRLIIELKDKVDSIQIRDNSIQMINPSEVSVDVENALLTLGYKPAEVKKVVREIFTTEKKLTTESAIKEAIKILHNMKTA